MQRDVCYPWLLGRELELPHYRQSMGQHVFYIETPEPKAQEKFVSQAVFLLDHISVILDALGLKKPGQRRKPAIISQPVLDADSARSSPGTVISVT